MKYKGQIGLLISMVILAGVIAIVMINFFSYSAVIKDDIQNISKLTSTNIYSEISNELTKPIFVSLTMANDSFVKDWLFNEKDRTDEEIIRYLNGIRSKYNYNSTFLISKESNKYFHYNGLHKIVSEKDKHDSWYFDFLNSDYIYDMDVDQDEADHNLLTLFINCKIFDDNGEVIGVTGVGLKMYYVQNLLESFEDEYDLEAFLLDENGIVQVHSTDDFILERNVFDEPLYKEFKADLLKKDSELHFFDSSGKDDSDYIIVRYIEDLNWFLIVRKDTSILRKSFMKQMGYEFLIYILLTLSVIYIVLRVISKHQMKLHDLAQTDSLTGLLNRRGFDIKLKSLINSDDMNNFSVFIFDLDGFKKVNDKYGHLQGDKIPVSYTHLTLPTN